MKYTRPHLIATLQDIGELQCNLTLLVGLELWLGL